MTNQSDAGADEDARLKARRRRTVSQLPGSIRKYVRALLEDMPDPTMVLEAGVGVLLHQQGEFLESYQRDCDRYARACQRAAEMRESVADLDETDPHRVRVEGYAARLEAVQPNHEAAARTTGDLVDKIRKVTDSLAVHRPHDYSRVTIELDVRGGAPWSADPGDSLHTTSTTEDDELVALVTGGDDGGR